MDSQYYSSASSALSSLSFNSLQTGKWIHSLISKILFVVVVKFQFPSNGKVDSQLPGERCETVQDNPVSIPFKRESGFTEVDPTNDIDDLETFQFPSNGKVDSQRVYDDAKKYLEKSVSIPFKRESGFTEVQKSREGINMLEFQFPSNGKVDSQRAPVLIPVGPWLRTSKTKRELHGTIFEGNFSPKIPQTRVGIDPNAIFW